MKVVPDTNVLISGLLWDGNERRLLKLCRAGTIQSVTLPQILIEVMDVVRRKFDPEGMRARRYAEQILVYSEVVSPRGILSVISEDASDNYVLETAILGKVDMIITGDSHLLRLGAYKGIRIVQTREVLWMLENG